MDLDGIRIRGDKWPGTGPEGEERGLCAAAAIMRRVGAAGRRMSFFLPP